MNHQFGYLDKSGRKSVIILILLALAAVAVFTIAGLRAFNTDDTQEKAADDKIAKNSGVDSTAATSNGKDAELFAFDPNTADSVTLARLGLSEYLIRNICRYRSKGGVFSRPTDFARVWGLTAGQYKKLEPYIQIAEDYRPAAEVYANDYHHAGSNYSSRGNGYTRGDQPSADAHQNSNTTAYNDRPLKLAPGTTLQINNADTTQLCRIPGIGPYFARKMMWKRESLGGFASKEQLTEIEGFPESALSYIKIDASTVRRLRINHSTAEQLRKHPYIDFRQAQGITDYRRINGDIKSISQLKSLRLFTDQMLQRLTPYLDFN